jgi:hypothetical protein
VSGQPLLAALGSGAIVGAMGDLFGEVAVSGPDIDPAQLVDVLGRWRPNR